MKDQYTILPDRTEILKRKPLSFDYTEFFDSVSFKISWIFSIVPIDKKKNKCAKNINKDISAIESNMNEFLVKSTPGPFSTCFLAKRKQTKVENSSSN